MCDRRLGAKDLELNEWAWGRGENVELDVV